MICFVILALLANVEADISHLISRSNEYLPNQNGNTGPRFQSSAGIFGQGNSNQPQFPQKVPFSNQQFNGGFNQGSNLGIGSGPQQNSGPYPSAVTNQISNSGFQTFPQFGNAVSQTDTTFQTFPQFGNSNSPGGRNPDQSFQQFPSGGGNAGPDLGQNSIGSPIQGNGQTFQNSNDLEPVSNKVSASDSAIKQISSAVQQVSALQQVSDLAPTLEQRANTATGPERIPIPIPRPSFARNNLDTRTGSISATTERGNVFITTTNPTNLQTRTSTTQPPQTRTTTTRTTQSSRRTTQAPRSSSSTSRTTTSSSAGFRISDNGGDSSSGREIPLSLRIVTPDPIELGTFTTTQAPVGSNQQDSGLASRFSNEGLNQNSRSQQNSSTTAEKPNRTGIPSFLSQPNRIASQPQQNNLSGNNNLANGNSVSQSTAPHWPTPAEILARALPQQNSAFMQQNFPSSSGNSGSQQNLPQFPTTQDILGRALQPQGGAFPSTTNFGAGSQQVQSSQQIQPHWPTSQELLSRAIGSQNGASIGIQNGNTRSQQFQSSQSSGPIIPNFPAAQQQSSTGFSQQFSQQPSTSQVGFVGGQQTQQFNGYQAQMRPNIAFQTQAQIPSGGLANAQDLLSRAIGQPQSGAQRFAPQFASRQQPISSQQNFGVPQMQNTGNVHVQQQLIVPLPQSLASPSQQQLFGQQALQGSNQHSPIGLGQQQNSGPLQTYIPPQIQQSGPVQQQFLNRISTQQDSQNLRGSAAVQNRLPQQERGGYQYSQPNHHVPLFNLK